MNRQPSKDIRPKPLSHAFDALKVVMAEAERSMNATSALLENRMDKIAAQREEAQSEAASLRAANAELVEALEEMGVFDCRCIGDCDCHSEPARKALVMRQSALAKHKGETK